jgi:hypothetical protein
MPITKATQNVVEGIVSTGSTGVSAGSFIVGQQYKITSLGTTTQSQWNTIAGTTGQTYVVGSLFTAATIGASSGNGAAAVARPLANRFADVVNVLDFGAVGDGVADDTDKIQNAFNAGKYIYIPSGTYLVTKTKLEALTDFGLKPQNGSTIVFSKGATIKLESGVDVRHIIAGINVNNVELVSCNIDGNNSFCNGIGFSGATNFRVTGGLIKNIKSVAQSITSTVGLGGGRAITFQYNCSNIVIDGVQFENCYTAVDATGKITGPSKSIVVSNIVANNCNVIFTALATDSLNLQSDLSAINTAQIVVNGVSFYNCGSSTGLDNRVNFSFVRQNSTGNSLPWQSPARTGTSFSAQDWLMDNYTSGDTEWSQASSYSVGSRVKYTNTGKDSCLFAVDQSSGVNISNVKGYNETSYGTIGAIIRGQMKNVSVRNFLVSVNTDYIFRAGPVPILSVTTRTYGASQNIKIVDVDNLGTTSYVFDSDGPIGVSNPFVVFYSSLENIGIQEAGNTALIGPNLVANAPSTGAGTMMWLSVRNISKGGTISGNTFQILNRSITDCNSADNGSYKTILAGGLQIKQNSTNSQLKLERTGTTAGSSELFANSTGMNCTTTLNLPNAAWNGSLLRLASYRFWVDSSGRLRIKGGSDPTSDTDGTVVGTQT